jgi:hypothetical protein
LAQVKIEDPRVNTEKLRGLRLADEAARKAAGTWGELSVGEVTHRPSGAVFLQVWKGARRPPVAGATNSRVAGVPAAEWPAVAAWLETVRADDLHRSIIAWSVSKTEAQRLKSKRMAEHRAAGLTIVNPAEPGEG